MKKKKVYVLMVSKTFPATHPRRGQLTYFDLLIQHAIGLKSLSPNINKGKLHTIRLNYELWKKRAEKINAGEAVLSLRQWSGEPYKSKQVEFMQLEKIGVEPVSFVSGPVSKAWKVGKHVCSIWHHYAQDSQTDFDFQEKFILAKHDGLSVKDFYHWFKKDFDGVVIHFTPFRYGNI